MPSDAFRASPNVAERASCRSHVARMRDFSLSHPFFFPPVIVHAALDLAAARFWFSPIRHAIFSFFFFHFSRRSGFERAPSEKGEYRPPEIFVAGRKRRRGKNKLYIQADKRELARHCACTHNSLMTRTDSLRLFRLNYDSCTFANTGIVFKISR